jgi:E3 ubiquitin-protein ligase RNF14
MTSASHEADEGTRACQFLQQEECEVLEVSLKVLSSLHKLKLLSIDFQSIYPEVVSNDISEGALKLEIPVEFGELRAMSVIGDPTLLASASETNHDAQVQMLSLSTLPPLLLHIILPPSYPLHSSPEIVSIHAIHMWLPRLSDLQNILIKMWNAGEGVLYKWVEFLRSGEFLNSMDLTTSFYNIIQWVNINEFLFLLIN